MLLSFICQVLIFNRNLRYLSTWEFPSYISDVLYILSCTPCNQGNTTNSFRCLFASSERTTWKTAEPVRMLLRKLIGSPGIVATPCSSCRRLHTAYSSDSRDLGRGRILVCTLHAHRALSASCVSECTRPPPGARLTPPLFLLFCYALSSVTGWIRRLLSIASTLFIWLCDE